MPALKYASGSIDEAQQQNRHQQFARMLPAVTPGHEVQGQQGKATGGMAAWPTAPVAGFAEPAEVFEPFRAQL
ncbi:hypothetical protein D3C75_961590 [compost metagenome]